MKNTDKVYNVSYTDAAYFYKKPIGKTKLSLHDAYGYVKKNGNNIIVTFIKKRGENRPPKIDKKTDIIKGLVVPDTALMSVVKTFKTDILKNVPVGANVEVTWRDVVYVANTPTYDCPIMYSEGIVHKIEKDHIVLKNPETIRVRPTPVRNHPVERARYYVIPISFITSIAVIK
ncbi:MAG: hypothetical protein NUV42_02100 [Candidatus Yonathbacteria bacterium]|nr:hypothetical protein [Candidatus Yonathbacteria bacterium]